MDMEIKDARIINVIVEPNGAGMRFGLELDLYDGTIWQTPCRTITPEDGGIKTLCDVVGARAIIELIGAHIRVLRDYSNVIHIIGNRTHNKWVDLNHFTFMYLQPGYQTIVKERAQKKMKDLNKVIARPYRMTEIRKRFDKLDLVEIDTYLDQGEYFLSKETDEDCRQYIFNTIAREIAEIAYIEPPEYTQEKAKHFRDTMTKHLLLALQYNEY